MAADQAALDALYRATSSLNPPGPRGRQACGRGTTWHRTEGWRTDAAAGGLAGRHGVAVDGGRVVTLDLGGLGGLTGNGLRGTLPADFLPGGGLAGGGGLPGACGLSHLRRLLLGSNLLSGPVPSALGALVHLEALSLFNNRFEGRVPDCFARLGQLAYLSVSKNRLTGPLPPSLVRGCKSPTQKVEPPLTAHNHRPTSTSGAGRDAGEGGEAPRLTHVWLDGNPGLVLPPGVSAYYLGVPQAVSLARVRAQEAALASYHAASQGTGE